MKKIILTVILSLFFMGVSAKTTEKLGVRKGGKIFATPDWFKDSFLDIADDVSEAKDNNKHIILFFHLDGCPYCDQMIKDFDSILKAQIQQDFEVIGLNIKGDRQVAFDTKTSMSEKKLAEKLQVRYTPTVLILNNKNQPVVRLNGYRDNHRMRQILAFAKDKLYQKMTLSDYLGKFQSNKKYPVYKNALFKKIKDFSTMNEPLAVIFDSNDCVSCERFYNITLKEKGVLAEAKKFQWVRLNANSGEVIIDNNGIKTTPKKWANRLKLNYRPGVILFIGGKEIKRVDGELYSYHYRELLRFVSNGYYKKYLRFGDYLKIRGEELVNDGIDIDYSK